MKKLKSPKIETKQDYEEATACIDELINSMIRSKGAADIEALSKAIEEYEAKYIARDGYLIRNANVRLALAITRIRNTKEIVKAHYELHGFLDDILLSLEESECGKVEEYSFSNVAKNEPNK